MAFKKPGGIGVDIVDVGRFRKLKGTARERFLSHAFTASERAYCEKRADAAESFAGTFAAKEAVFKAAGEKSFLEYEIRHDKNGKPEVWRKGKRMTSVLVSISHTKDCALAVAISGKK